MKILVVCQHYKPEPFRISDICEAMVAAGHEVTVVTGVPNYPAGEIYPGYEKSWGKETVENGVRVRRCFTLARKTGIIHRVLNYYSFAWSSTRYLSRVQETYDVVFVNQLSPVMMAQGAIRYARKWGKRVVLYCLDLWPESLTAGGIRRGSAIYRLFFGISKRIYQSVDQLLVTSRGFAPYLNEYLNVPGRCEHLPQYAEDLFGDVAAWAQHERPYHFVFAGNIGDIQSVDTIIEAARLLKDDPRAVFDIVGDGSAYENCVKLAQGLPNVVFHGRKDVSQMPEFYAAADAMLVTLKNNPAISITLPGKIQSYMAAGRAVVGAIGGEAAAVIAEARCGVCAAPENAEELARKVTQLLDDPKAFGEYGENAKKYYRDFFCKEAFMKKLMAVLAENCVNK